jgi:secreted Zn-dependent insulinase-like peptidase
MSTFKLEEFKKFKITTRNFLEERQNNTYQLYSKYFNEIVENTFLFEREKLLLNKLDSITYEIFKKFYQEKILDSINTNSFTKIYIRKQ